MTNDELKKLADEIESKCVQIERHMFDGGIGGVYFRSTICVEMLEALRDQVLKEAEDAFENEYANHDSPLKGVIFGMKAIRALKSGKQ